MKVKEARARKFLKALGFEGAEGAKVKGLEKTLNRLYSNQADLNEVQGKDEVLLRSIFEALKEGDVISVTPEEEEEEVAIAATKKKVKNAPVIEEDEAPVAKKGRKPVEEEPAPKKKKPIQIEEEDEEEERPHPGRQRQPRDKFGSRLGTDCAKVNSVLTHEYKTESDIRQESGARSIVVYHLDKLVRLGHAKWKKGQGYALAD
jgi:outer membrane biosynthesis protein TonB